METAGDTPTTKTSEHMSHMDTHQWDHMKVTDPNRDFTTPMKEARTENNKKNSTIWDMIQGMKPII